MKNYDDSFCIEGEIRGFYLDWNIIFLILIESHLIYNFSDNIEAAMDELLIYLKFVISFCKNLIPPLSVESSKGVIVNTFTTDDIEIFFN